MALIKCEALIAKVLEDETPQLVKGQIDVPQPGPHEALVKISHVAQNPTDVQSFDSKAFGTGATLGCDFVGTVTATGDAVTRITRGDTIAGLIWGGEIHGRGAYSQYTVADEKICFRVPNGIPLEAAATVPLAALTAWLALFSKDCLAIERSDDAEKPAVLIWGGSSSVGQYAIQLAALHDLEVLTTCSPKHFDHVRSLGAQHVFDYNDPEVVEQIRRTALPKPKVTGLFYAFDTIGTRDSSRLASEAVILAEEYSSSPASSTSSQMLGIPPTICTVRPGKGNTEDVAKGTKITDVLVWTAFLREHNYAEFTWPANRADHDLAAEFCDKISEWLGKGEIKANKTRIIDGGLDAVVDGFREYREGKVSGYKIVYNVS